MFCVISLVLRCYSIFIIVYTVANIVSLEAEALRTFFFFFFASCDCAVDVVRDNVRQENWCVEEQGRRLTWARSG